MRVTGIETTKKGRYALMVDGEFAFSLHRDTFLLCPGCKGGRGVAGAAGNPAAGGRTAQRPGTGFGPPFGGGADQRHPAAKAAALVRRGGRGGRCAPHGGAGAHQ